MPSPEPTPAPDPVILTYEASADVGAPESSFEGIIWPGSDGVLVGISDVGQTYGLYFPAGTEFFPESSSLILPGGQEIPLWKRRGAFWGLRARTRRISGGRRADRVLRGQRPELGQPDETMATGSSFEEIYAEHQPRIFAVARQRIRDRALAEDVTSEVFRIAFEYHRSGRKLTSPWLYTTLRHLVANQYRRARRDLDYLATLGAGRRDAAGEGATDAALVVAHALRRLAKDDREILRMAYWEDLSRAEIAAVLGCSAGAVRVRLLRARKRLAAILGEPAAPSLPGGGRR